MTGTQLFIVAVCVGLVAVTVPAVLALVEPTGGKHSRSLVDVLVAGLFLVFVAAVAVAYIGATLP